jgi:hypothetical protein
MQATSEAVKSSCAGVGFVICCAFVIFVRALDDFSHACAARVRDVARSSRPEPCAALLQLQPRARPRRRRAGEAFMAGPCRTGRRGIRFPRPRERPASVSSRHLNLGLPCCMLEREGLRPFGTVFLRCFSFDFLICFFLL